MKQYTHFFGVDISKKTIDVTLLKDMQVTHRQFSNDSAGINELMQWLAELNLSYDCTLFCMEATGLYCFALTQFLAVNSIDTWIEHAAQIKKQMPSTEVKMIRLIPDVLPSMLQRTWTVYACGSL
jgi:transposase